MMTKVNIKVVEVAGMGADPLALYQKQAAVREITRQRGVDFQHNETVAAASKPGRGFWANHNQKAVAAAKPRRTKQGGMGYNNNQTMVFGPRKRLVYNSNQSMLRQQTLNHNQTAVAASKPRRGRTWNHNQTAVANTKPSQCRSSTRNQALSGVLQASQRAMTANHSQTGVSTKS